MAPNDLHGDQDLAAAFHGAVSCFPPPAGLKETVAARLSNPNVSEAIDRAALPTAAGPDNHRSLRRILKWAPPLAAACLLTGIVIFALSHSDTAGPTSGDGRTRTLAGGAPGAGGEMPVSPRSTHGTVPLISEQVLGSVSLVARARVAGWDNGIIRYNVVHVIYGNFADQSVLVDYSGVIESSKGGVRTQAGEDLGHEPTPIEFEEYVLKQSGIEKGREMILFLISRPTRPVQPRMYLQLGAYYDLPPAHGMDDAEDRIIRIIADGGYLSPSFPQPADFLGQHIRAADLIVRAQLSQVTETDSRWTVSAVIKGQTQEKTLILPHDLFRLRAQAIIQHRRQTTQPATEPSLEEQIAAEMNRLLKAELVPNLQAILFVSDPKVEGQTVKANLLQRIYEDASGQRLDEAVRVIRAAEAHQLPVAH